MPEEHDIRITQWPKQKALLEHYFKLDEPCPVSIFFEEKPAHVKVGNEKGESFDVDMNMNLKVTETIPVCIKVCEPICAVSDYTVGIQLFGQPFVAIKVNGKTRIEPCASVQQPQSICVDFSKVDPKQNVQIPTTVQGIQFTPLNDSSQQKFTTMGNPAGVNKLSIPNEGMRIDFPDAVNNVELTIVNFGNPVIQINAFNNSNMISNQTEMIQNNTATISVNGTNITAIEIKGGSNEAALYNVCFQRAVRPNDSNVRIL